MARRRTRGELGAGWWGRRSPWTKAGLVASALAVAVAVAASVTPDPRDARTARVVEVVDGDTLRLADGRRVRLVQIDAPELAAGECWAAEAADALTALVPPGTQVRLERDPALDDLDRFGRLLRYVHRDSTNVSLALVRQGAASPWFYDRARGRYAAELLRAAEEARFVGRGLWGGCPGTRLDPTRGVETVE